MDLASQAAVTTLRQAVLDGFFVVEQQAVFLATLSRPATTSEPARTITSTTSSLTGSKGPTAGPTLIGTTHAASTTSTASSAVGRNGFTESSTDGGLSDPALAAIIIVVSLVALSLIVMLAVYHKRRAMQIGFQEPPPKHPVG